MTKIVDSTYDLVYEHVLVKKNPKEVTRGISLRMSNVDRRSTVPRFDDLTLLEIGDSALFPDWRQENASAGNSDYYYIF